jgi:hypothetical protein
MTVNIGWNGLKTRINSYRVTAEGNGRCGKRLLLVTDAANYRSLTGALGPTPILRRPPNMTVRQPMTTIEVLDPAGQVQQLAALQCNPVTMPLQGRRLGILDNSKPNFKRLATLVAERLRADEIAVDIAYFRKENPAVGASPELLDQIARSADLVITGSAD